MQPIYLRKLVLDSSQIWKASQLAIEPLNPTQRITSLGVIWNTQHTTVWLGETLIQKRSNKSRILEIEKQANSKEIQSVPLHGTCVIGPAAFKTLTNRHDTKRPKSTTVNRSIVSSIAGKVLHNSQESTAEKNAIYKEAIKFTKTDFTVIMDASLTG